MKNIPCDRFVQRASLLFATSLVCTAAGCSPQVLVPTDVVRPVKTMVVTVGEDSRMRTFPGMVDASKRVELAFQVPGRIDKLPVKEGQDISEGELIAQLREDEFRARLTSIQGQLNRARADLQAARAGERPEERLRREADVRAARARLANARADLDRYARLLPTRAIPRAEYEQAETTYHVAQEDYEAAQQILEKGSIAREEDIQAKGAEVMGLEGRVVEAQIQLADCTLLAPYNGVIAQRFVEEGQNVQAKQPIVRFQDAEEVEIVVDVPESVMAADIRRADIVQLVARVTGAPGLEFPVHIREIAQVADPTTQTFQVRVAMKAPSDIRVLPGMTATVVATYRRASILGNRILVPISAVFQESSGEQVVWLIGPDDAAVRRPVKLGEASGGQIEIVEGLAPGDRMATAGVTFLRDGMQVRDLGNALGNRQP